MVYDKMLLNSSFTHGNSKKFHNEGRVSILLEVTRLERKRQDKNLGLCHYDYTELIALEWRIKVLWSRAMPNTLMLTDWISTWQGQDYTWPEYSPISEGRYRNDLLLRNTLLEATSRYFDMKSTVYALAESAFFRVTPYHYVLAALIVAHFVRWLLNRVKFVKSVAWIPGPPALPVVGNALSLTVEQDEFYRLLLRCGEEYGRIFRLWVGMRPFVFLARAEDIQPILNSVQHIDKSLEYSFLKDWLGEGLITVTGLKWQKRRKMLTPCFHWDMLAEFAENIESQVDILVETLSDISKKQKPFNVLPVVKLCTLDIICVTAMGKEVGAQRNANCDYATAVEAMTGVLVRRFITPWLKPDVLFNLSSLGRTQKQALRIVDDFVGGVIQARKAERKTKAANTDSNGVTGHRAKKAFLDLLLEANENGASLTDKDLEDEVNTFMFAGHDTTATTVSWCLYVLGKQPEAQMTIVQEYKDVMQDEGSIYDNLKKLSYLEMCIKETLRLYPVAPLIARDIKNPVNLPGGRVLPAGVTALIHSPMLHRDPTFFPDPDTFIPERFQDANPNRHAFSYIPFSAGPRNCIGQRFAQMTTKLIVAKILKSFHVTSVVPESKLNLVSDIVLNNKEGISIVLTPRD